MFVVPGSADDPPGPEGRITPAATEAADLSRLREFDPERFAAYHVIDAGLHRDTNRARRVRGVSCDAMPRSGLTRAVEVVSDDGRIILTRRPAGVSLEEFPIP